RHTRCYRDWSSDVCSSDLSSERTRAASSNETPCFLRFFCAFSSSQSYRAASSGRFDAQAVNTALVLLYWQVGHRIRTEILQEKRSEERRVGKAGRSDGSKA